MNHAEYTVLIIDATFIPLVESVQDRLDTVETIIVTSSLDTIPENNLKNVLSYEELIKDESNLLREGLWLSTSQKVLNKIDTQDTANHKIFLGYSGWGPEQLEKEIQDGAWHVCDVDFELIFNDKPSSIIEELSKKVGYNIKSIINQNKVQ